MKSARHGKTRLASLLLLLANALIPIAILTFATGFFPHKPVLPGLAQYDTTKHELPPAAPFDKVILMVIDALRSDFVYADDSGFQFTQSLIRNGGAIPFTAHATSPTVTMPRIKAITTGSIPSFLDVILNIDEGDSSSSLASQDTWLAQIKSKDTGKLMLYGDDTWLKLFPDFFDVHDGTSSFFVADFTEVDNNVTRHVPDMLRRDDWSTVVLHYLGLDHIGHKGGPRSSNMLPKQKEMDGIIEELYTALENQEHLKSTLLVVLGDHGMNDAGNHGGSAPGETSPALLFVSPKMETLGRNFTSPQARRFKDSSGGSEDFEYYSMVEQSDLAPTLGALLGFPPPRNNLGVMIRDFLPFWTKESDWVDILMRNAEQMLAIMTTAFGEDMFDSHVPTELCQKPDSEVEKLACRWREVQAGHLRVVEGEASSEPWVAEIFLWLEDAQELMSGMASNYDLGRLYLGLAMIMVAVVCSVTALIHMGGVTWPSSVLFAGLTLLYGIMMFASSYIEEEHHFWYWATAAWAAVALINRSFTHTTRNAAIAALLIPASRLIRGWNQTGQKYQGEPDLVKVVLAPSPELLWILVVFTYIWNCRQLIKGFDRLTRLSVMQLCGALTLAAFTFKLAFTMEDAPEIVSDYIVPLARMLKGASLILRARIVFAGIALATTGVVVSMFTRKGLSTTQSPLETLRHLFTLLAMVQSRVTNAPLFLLFEVQRAFLAPTEQAASGTSSISLSTAAIILSHASFFAMGGSNGISSIDLSNAYNGISGFHARAVGLLTFVSNWAGPIYWTFATTSLLVNRARQMKGVTEDKVRVSCWTAYLQHISTLTVFVAVSTAFVMAACTALRTHLFIWTVFSPKYLYCMAWSIGQHLLVDVGVGGILFGLGMLGA